MRGFVSARSRAQLLDVLLSAQIALLALQVVGWLLVAVVGEGDLARMVFRGSQRAGSFEGLLFLMATATFASWAFRVASNLGALSLENRSVTPGTALVVSLVPLVNLVGVPLVARALWLDSDPTPPPARRLWWHLGVWWGALGASLMLHGPERGDAGAQAVANAVAAALWAVAAYMCLRIVRQVQYRQDEQWLDAERRRGVPSPSADRLR